METIQRLQITILTLLSVILIGIGLVITYFSSGNTKDVYLALGIALTEMGLLGVLYEHVIKKLEERREEEITKWEKMEGRSCITETLTLRLHIEDDTVETLETETLYFTQDKHLSPLVYLDALHIKGHWVNSKPRIEAYLETTRKHTLIDHTNTQKYCHINANAYICKNPTAILITKNQTASLTTIRRYYIDELTDIPTNITYNRQLWRPTQSIKIEIPTAVENNYRIAIHMIDYNGDIIETQIDRKLEGSTVSYTLKPADKRRKRFYIMDKIIINMVRRP